MENQNVKKHGVLGIISLIFGITTILLPILALVGMPFIIPFLFGAVAIVTAIISIVKKNKIVMPIIGIVLAVMGIVSCLVCGLVFNVIKEVTNNINLDDLGLNHETSDTSVSLGTTTTKQIDEISGNSWIGVKEDSLLKLNSYGTFKYYRNKNNLLDNYYEGTYSVYVGKKAIDYITVDLAKYGVTKSELDGVFSRNEEYSEDNFYVLVLNNLSCIVDGKNILEKTTTTPYFGFYLKDKEILDIANMNTSTYVTFKKQ